MFKITLENVQCIKNTVFEIEENSIVEFTGDNSNGKSVLSKVVGALTSGDIKHKETRLTLISDGCDFGSVIFLHNKEMLGLVMRIETRESFICYQGNIDDENTRIIRFLNEGGIEELVYQFGFRTYDKGGICLQLHPTWGAIPFVTTSSAINNDIVRDITTDKVADEFLRMYKTVTYPIFKDRITRLNSQVEKYKSILDNMTDYDWEAYGKVADEMLRVYKAIEYYQYYQIEELPIPPISKIIDLPLIQLDPIPIVRIGPIMQYGLYKMEEELNSLHDVLSGKCPTCGRPLIECKEIS